MPLQALALDIVALKSADLPPYNEALEGFKGSCDCEVRELGISENEGGNLAKTVLGMRPDAVLAIGRDALAQVQGIREVPVFFTMITQLDPALAPRRNISGVSMLLSAEAWLNSSAELFPAARHIGVLYDPRNSGPFVREALSLAQSRGIELVAKEVREPRAVFAAIDGMKDRADLLWMLPDVTVVNSESFNYMLNYSFRNKTPILSFSRKYAELGATAALHVSPFDLGAQTAEAAKALLAGQTNGPVRSPAGKVRLTVNRKVAGKIGVRFRDSVLKKAGAVN